MLTSTAYFLKENALKIQWRVKRPGMGSLRPANHNQQKPHTTFQPPVLRSVLASLFFEDV